ncbi:MAG: hypothetical protein WCT36_02355 [Candidatus Gracilibacteria bacterium]|jgi:hypothetical protein
METLRDIHVTDEDIARTYRDGVELLEQFRVVKKIAEGGGGMHEVGISKDVHGTYEQKHRAYKAWITRGIVPRPVKSVKKLYEIGAFPTTEKPTGTDPLDVIVHDTLKPFTIDCDLFPLLSLVMSAEFWKGTFTIRSYGNNFGIRGDGGILRECLIKVLGARYHHSANERNPKLALNASIGRLISLLGQPHKKHASDEYPVPRPIELALNTLNSDDASPSEKLAARTIVEGFALTLFNSDKCSFSKTRGYSIGLNTIPHPELMAQRHDLIVAALKHGACIDHVTTSGSRIIKLPDLVEDDIRAFRTRLEKIVAGFME